MNLNADDPVGARNRAILFSLVTLVVIGAVLGLGVGWLGSRAVDSTGIDDIQPPEDARVGATEPVDDFTAPPGATGPTSEETTPTEPPETTKPTKNKPNQVNRRKPTLNASPKVASASERVSLTGRFPGLGAGVTLQVERRRGGTWTDFPVDMTTDPGGKYSTWIVTENTGANLFRVTASTGESTPVVVVRIN